MKSTIFKLTTIRKLKVLEAKANNFKTEKDCRKVCRYMGKKRAARWLKRPVWKQQIWYLKTQLL